MIERQLFLRMLQDFRLTIEKCVDLSERARRVPLGTSTASEELESIVRHSHLLKNLLIQKSFQTTDLNDIQNTARDESDRISEQQRRADMTVTDFEYSVRKLNETIRSPISVVALDEQVRDDYDNIISIIDDISRPKECLGKNSSKNMEK